MKNGFILFLLLLNASIFLAGPAYSEIKYTAPQNPSVAQPQEDQEPQVKIDTAPVTNIDDEFFFQYTRGQWLEMRRAIEEGRKPGEKVEQSTASAVTPELPPPSTGGTIELPYETRLSIQGSKVIGMKYSYRTYDNHPDNLPGNKDSGSFEMEQSLVVKISGQVGKKIAVNVNFDDTQPDVRDISVAYHGDPDEVVQEAAFGDIMLSLPNTEFVGYSRQAFGIKLTTKYKNLRTYFIGSQAKGTPASKKFTGSTQMEKPLIQDTSYAKRKYFQLTFFSTETLSNDGNEEIYMDDRNPANDLANSSKDLSYSSYTARDTVMGSIGKFDRFLSSRGDYTIDYSKGIVIFRNAVPDNAIIVVNYKRTDGSYLVDPVLNSGSTNYLLIKDDQNTPGITREMKSYYYLNRTQIVRDNDRGNFFLKIVKDSGEEPTLAEWKRDTGLDAIPKYPVDIRIDFESGIFNIVDSSGNPWNVFPSQVYQGVGTHALYRFYIEYRYRTKQFDLNPPGSMIPQSEQIVLDGKTLQRDKDYIMDYDLGRFTFLNENMFNDNSVIDVNYEYAPFGGLQVGETFVGIRNELSLTQNMFVGVSYLKNFPPRPQSIPDLKSVAGDLTITEVDSRIQNLRYGPFSLGFGGEYAQSIRNMNTYGKAMIDSMEGIKQGEGPALARDSWKYGWTVQNYPPNSLTLFNEDELLRNIYGIEQAKDEKQSVLRITYDLTRATESAVAQLLSPTGIDFSKKTALELKLYGRQTTGSAFTDDDYITIEFGKFNEDVDHDGSFDTEDISSNSILNDGEDIGWLFNTPDWPLSADQLRTGANNGLIDSEDLDGDRIFNNSEMIDQDKKFQIKMNDFNNTWAGIQKEIIKIDPNTWLYIKEIRITIHAPGKAGDIRFAKIDAVGNKWENMTPSGLTLKAVNNYDDQRYRDHAMNQEGGPMLSEYESLYGKQIIGTFKQEQSLEMNYQFTSSSVPAISTGTLVAKLSLGSGEDFSVHEKLVFFLYGDNNNEILVLRANTDNDSNYFEYKTLVNWQGWRKIVINQAPVVSGGEDDEDKTPKRWEADLSNPGTVAECSGNGFGIGSPSLAKISYLQFLIVSSDTINGISYPSVVSAAPSYVWIDEIHMTNSRTRDGSAYKGYVDLGIDRWANFGGKYKYKSPNFETFDARAVGNQKAFEQSGYFNFSRLSFMPMNFTGARTETRTTSIDKSADYVSILQVGRVITTNFTAGARLNINKLPSISYNYSINTTSSSNQASKYYLTNERVSHDASLNYTIGKLTKIDPIDSFIPQSLSVGGGLTVNKDEPWLVMLSTFDPTLNPVKREYSERYNISAPFQMFWSKFSLNPSYSHTNTYEKREIPNFPKYDKSDGQTIGLGTSLMVTNWFTPRANYSLSTNESFDFAGITDPALISKTKSVTRNGSASVSADLGMGRIFPKFNPTKSLSLNSSYSIQDGDKYDRVGSTYPALNDIWIRDPLKNGTLSSLTRSDTVSSSSRWNLFEGLPLRGKLAPLSRTSTSLGYSEQKSFSFSGSKSKNRVLTWPDLTVSLYDMEKTFGGEKYVSDTSLTLTNRYRQNKSYNVIDDTDVPQVESRNIDNSVSLHFNSRRYIKSLSVSFGESKARDYSYIDKRFTRVSTSFNYSLQPSFDALGMTLTPRYSYQEDKAWAGDPDNLFDGPTVKKNPTNDLRTKTASISFYKDASFPGGMFIPIIGKTLPLTNRFIFNTSLSYTERDSDINIGDSRTTEYGVTMSGNYTISDNLSSELGAGYNRFINRQVSDKNWTSYSINARLTIAF
ncbi:MAG: hypothetical protein A3J83_08170 [Elusimicrobia bacterium RIFOXYA2_FULL_40_6]|nr:MAG: hypothetical protein A3J83_08170 [Elusimicrobia bacterium RIFOXYA2_FULL_40_6]